MIGELLWRESTFMLDTDPGMPWWLEAGLAAGFREFMIRSLSVAAAPRILPNRMITAERCEIIGRATHALRDR